MPIVIIASAGRTSRCRGRQFFQKGLDIISIDNDLRS